MTHIEVVVVNAMLLLFLFLTQIFQHKAHFCYKIPSFQKTLNLLSRILVKGTACKLFHL